MRGHRGGEGGEGGRPRGRRGLWLLGRPSGWEEGHEGGCGWTGRGGGQVRLQLFLYPEASLWKVGLTDKTLTTFTALLPLCASTLRSGWGGRVARAWRGGQFGEDSGIPAPGCAGF